MITLSRIDPASEEGEESRLLHPARVPSRPPFDRSKRSRRWTKDNRPKEEKEEVPSVVSLKNQRRVLKQVDEINRQRNVVRQPASSCFECEYKPNGTENLPPQCRGCPYELCSPLDDTPQLAEEPEVEEEPTKPVEKPEPSEWNAIEHADIALGFLIEDGLNELLRGK